MCRGGKSEEMSCANPELRGELERRGLWRDFMRLRDDAKAKGMSPAEARKSAVEQVAPDLAGMVPVAPGHPKRGASEGKAERQAKVRELRKAEAERKADPEPCVGKSVPARKAAPRYEDFAGKKAGWGETVDWVVAALGFEESDVDLGTAPDAKAISYYRACRESPSFKQDFMIRIGAARLPKKIEEDGGGPGDAFDGQGEYDLAGAIAGSAGGSGDWDGSGGEAVER